MKGINNGPGKKNLLGIKEIWFLTGSLKLLG